ncbi:SDR family NAD(P)-dependent oxidoreductase [Aliiglaciecola sp. NS0011-25]|uniref:SDR family NAD(P)-dependent oxidoreductase n=1 Tax=Aliiglaciecola sp. NS0011-25 TaxID=3127654 RepID=UPI00310B1AE0
MTKLNTVLITGASEGIGRSFAETFAKHGHDLVLVARNQQKLNELSIYLNAKYAVTCHVYPTDLSLKHSAQKLYEQLMTDKIEVDILVNNAGMMQIDPIQQADVETLNNLIQLNIQSLVNMTRVFVGPMIAKGEGRIVNVGSIASFMPTPSFSAYGASKAFVLSFSEGISEDLKGTGVTVTCVCPGITETKMLSGAHGVEQYIPSFLKAQPDSLTNDAYKAMIKGDVVFLDKLANKMLVQYATHYPRWMVRRINGLFRRFTL